MTLQRPALVLSVSHSQRENVRMLGREAYSYRFVYDAFLPILERWGSVTEITHPESRLDYALWRARRQGFEPIHLSFLPLHMMYLSQIAPTVAFPFWEFPDIPDWDIANNPRNNWLRIANQCSLILTACRFTRQAFVKAGVRAPIGLISVPVQQAYFSVPDWHPSQCSVLDCPCYVLTQPPQPCVASRQSWVPVQVGVSQSIDAFYRAYVRSYVPSGLRTCARLACTAAIAARRAHNKKSRVACPVQSTLDLSGVVYTTVLNPHDYRKNWKDILSSFILALRDKDDATLVMKLALSPEMTALGVNEIIEYYHELGVDHRCKLALLSAYLPDYEMVRVASASTYYINASRAEGACLPLQSFLAAGRPAIAPAHTAMADYFDESLGFVVDSSPEPAYFPHDARKRRATFWQRIDWQSLHDQIQASYEMARHHRRQYEALATRGRKRMEAMASTQSVWPRLAEILQSVIASKSGEILRQAS